MCMISCSRILPSTESRLIDLHFSLQFCFNINETRGACLLYPCIFLFVFFLFQFPWIFRNYIKYQVHIQVLIVAERQLFQVRNAAKLSLTVFFTQPWFHIIAYPKLSHLKPIPFGMRKKWRYLSTSIFLNSIHYTCGFTVQSHLNPFMSWTKNKTRKMPFYFLCIFLLQTSAFILHHILFCFTLIYILI